MTPRKSQDNDEEENGLSFQNMMSMIMYQNQAESEQRERQSRIDAEQRDWEDQLRREETAIAYEDARTQRQLMNVMMMAMLNKNGWGIVLNLDLPPAAL
jgi:homoserine acetyltransferase